MIVLFYPCRSLIRQIKHWLERHGGYLSRITYSRSLPEIRRRMRHADVVIVDASDDAALACDVFLQAISVIGPKSTAVYTERPAADVEQLVRRFGVPFFLGPMNGSEWEAYFAPQFSAIFHLSAAEALPTIAEPSAPVPAGEEAVDFPLYRSRAG